VQADRYNFSKVQSLSQVSTFNDIYPSLIRRDAYVFLGYSNVRRSTSTISFAGDLITYHYPLAFLDDNKDLIYSNGGARVYR
jgi:muramoyltetrapeptide carboxypeptidase LdcA involved in peptidoglycan recycling